MKEWDPPSHFHIAYTNSMGGYVYQFSSLISKKWDFGEPVIKSLQIGVSKLFRTTVLEYSIQNTFHPIQARGVE